MSEKNPAYLSAAQIRGARGIINWSQEELAAAANLSVATVRKLELGHISPRSDTTQHIRKAFEDAGLEFIEPDGVRHRPEDVTVYRGHEGVVAFFDDVYHTTKKKGGEIVQVWPSAYPFLEAIGDFKNIHIERMRAIKDSISVKCIFTQSDSPMPGAGYAEYRWISRSYVDSVSFYVYNDKYAVIDLATDPSPKITVIQSRAVADAFRQQFYSMWDKATPLNEKGESEMVKPVGRKRASAR